MLQEDNLPLALFYLPSQMFSDENRVTGHVQTSLKFYTCLFQIGQ